MSWLETLPPGLHAVELTGRDRSKALREFDGFADTDLLAELEPIEGESSARSFFRQEQKQ